MTPVTIVQGEDRRGLIREACLTLGEAWSSKIAQATSILVKPNLVHHERQLASTHVDAVRGVIDAIRQVSQAPIIIGDAGYHGTKAAFRNFGYLGLPDEYKNVSLVDLSEDETVEGHAMRSDDSPIDIRRAKLAVTSDVRISLAPMKTHHEIGVSLCVHNWTFGTWVVPSRIGLHGRVWARWPWLAEEGVAAVHKTIVKLYAEQAPDFAVIDGVSAMEGKGPTRGTAVPMNVVLAGPDAVAVDTVATTLMGIDPSTIAYLVQCQEKGLGVADMAKIDAPPLLVASLRRTFLR